MSQSSHNILNAPLDFFDSPKGLSYDFGIPSSSKGPPLSPSFYGGGFDSSSHSQSLDSTQGYDSNHQSQKCSKCDGTMLLRIIAKSPQKSKKIEERDNHFVPILNSKEAMEDQTPRTKITNRPKIHNNILILQIKNGRLVVIYHDLGTGEIFQVTYDEQIRNHVNKTQKEQNYYTLINQNLSNLQGKGPNKTYPPIEEAAKNNERFSGLATLYTARNAKKQFHVELIPLSTLKKTFLFKISMTQMRHYTTTEKEFKLRFVGQNIMKNPLRIDNSRKRCLSRKERSSKVRNTNHNQQNNLKKPFQMTGNMYHSSGVNNDVKSVMNEIHSPELAGHMSAFMGHEDPHFNPPPPSMNMNDCFEETYIESNKISHSNTQSMFQYHPTVCEEEKPELNEWNRHTVVEL